MATEAGVDLSALTDLDRLVHEPARLSLMSHLYVVEAADFLYLKRETRLTQGNLSSHLSKLEAGGYVEVSKGFSGKRPQTTIRLSPHGRKAFDAYVRSMRSVLERLG